MSRAVHHERGRQPRRARAPGRKTKNDELVVENARLLEANEKLEKEFKSLQGQNN